MNGIEDFMIGEDKAVDLESEDRRSSNNSALSGCPQLPIKTLAINQALTKNSPIKPSLQDFNYRQTNILWVCFGPCTLPAAFGTRIVVKITFAVICIASSTAVLTKAGLCKEQ